MFAEEQLPEPRQEGSPEPLGRWDWLFPIALAAVFFLIGRYRLGAPDFPLFDEIFHARTAMEYLLGVEIYEWTHPPLAKLLMAFSLWLGHAQFSLLEPVVPIRSVIAWRTASLSFGCGALIAQYALARTMFGSRAVATLASVLLALDGVFLVQSRTGMTNIYEVTFLLFACLGTWQFIKVGQVRWLSVTAVGLGLGLATRWTALYAVAFTLLLIAGRAYFVERLAWGAIPDADADSDEAKLLTALKNADHLRMLAWTVRVGLPLIVIPAAIYLISYVPNVLQGPGPALAKLTSWNYGLHGWGWVGWAQRAMWNYHSKLKYHHPFASPWWSWPLMLKPCWYYFSTPARGQIGVVWAIGNPIVWWAAVPSLAAAAWFAVKEKQAGLAFLAVFGLGNWFMWGLQPRAETFMHYLLETIPFAAIALAFFLVRLWRHGRLDGRTRLDLRRPRRLVVAVMALAVLGDALLYPLLTDYPLSLRLVRPVVTLAVKSGDLVDRLTDGVAVNQNVAANLKEHLQKKSPFEETSEGLDFPSDGK